MNMQEKVKKIVLGAMVCCIAISSIAYAAESPQTEQTAPQTQHTKDSGIPWSMYMRSSSVNFGRITGKVGITVTTSAFTKVEHVYHDVTIYKNGYWYSSERYNDWNKLELITPIKIPAQTGDIFEVYVDHYTDHLGYLETMHSERTMVY